MKNLILTFAVAIIASTSISQIHFDYLLSPEENIHEVSSGTIYYTSDPDTVIINDLGSQRGIVYMFNDGVEEAFYIPIHKIEHTIGSVIYYGETYEARYTTTYYKSSRSFTIAAEYYFEPFIFLYFHNRDSEEMLELSDFTNDETTYQ